MIRIGNAQGFWGDRPDAAFQLLSQQPDLDFLTLDYLAELSLSIMAIQRQKEPSLGYAADFLQVIESLTPLWKQGSRCKVVTNAGGLNPAGCAKACQELLQRAGLSLKIAVVSGDDVLDQMRDKRLITANAYLGAQPIAEALKQRAQIVITGRVADPSLTVGPCLAHFDWLATDYDKLAQATVAGHLLECGTQVTGGISHDWLTLPDVAHIGFPLIEMSADGRFVVTKPLNTGGEVSIHAVKEQLLYEIGDPANYLSPDVIVSFLTVQLTLEGKNRIRVEGATGRPPPDTLKVSACYPSGFRSEGTLMISGWNAKTKAQRSAEVIYQRLCDQNLQPERWYTEAFGTDPLLLRIAVADPRRQVLETFAKEMAPLVTAGAPGTSGYTFGRPKIRPLFGYEPTFILASNVKAKVEILGVL